SRAGQGQGTGVADVVAGQVQFLQRLERPRPRQRGGPRGGQARVSQPEIFEIAQVARSGKGASPPSWLCVSLRSSETSGAADAERASTPAPSACSGLECRSSTVKPGQPGACKSASSPATPSCVRYRYSSRSRGNEAWDSATAPSLLSGLQARFRLSRPARWGDVASRLTCSGARRL